MNLKKSTTTKTSPPKEEAPKEEVKEVVEQAIPKASSLKEAYPHIESLKNALKKGDDSEKKRIAELTNADPSDIPTNLTIWKNA